MLTFKQVKARVRQQPFRPLRIVTMSGEMYNVMHPDLVLVGERELIVGNPSRMDPTLFDGTHRIPLMDIRAIEDLPV